jgi:ABC-type glycerol-3-phosphate transport system substrate-binding protein
MADFTKDMKALSAHGPKAYGTEPYPDSWFPWAIDQGATYLTPGGAPDLTNPALTKSFGWYADMVHTQHWAPQVPSTTPGWSDQQFQAGNVAMAIDGPWDLINTKQTVKFKFGIAPLPTVNGTSKTLVAGSGFGIAKSCAYKDSAWKAIQELTSPEAEQYLATQGRAFPARTAQQTYWYKNAVPGSQPALQAALKDAVPYKTTANWDRTSQLITQYGVSALNGKKQPADVLKTVQSQATQ